MVLKGNLRNTNKLLLHLNQSNLGIRQGNGASSLKVQILVDTKECREDKEGYLIHNSE